MAGVSLGHNLQLLKQFCGVSFFLFIYTIFFNMFSVYFQHSVYVVPIEEFSIEYAEPKLQCTAVYGRIHGQR